MVNFPKWATPSSSIFKPHPTHLDTNFSHSHHILKCKERGDWVLCDQCYYMWTSVGEFQMIKNFCAWQSISHGTFQWKTILSLFNPSSFMLCILLIKVYMIEQCNIAMSLYRINSQSSRRHGASFFTHSSQLITLHKHKIYQ